MIWRDIIRVRNNKELSSFGVFTGFSCTHTFMLLDEETSFPGDRLLLEPTIVHYPHRRTEHLFRPVKTVSYNSIYCYSISPSLRTKYSPLYYAAPIGGWFTGEGHLHPDLAVHSLEDNCAISFGPFLFSLFILIHLLLYLFVANIKTRLFGSPV